jgi:hypothetical protein
VRYFLISLVIVACGPDMSSDAGPGGSGGGGSGGGGSGGGGSGGSGSGSQGGSSCVPATCASTHAGCGPISDGCGAMLDCGSCTYNDRCVANQCTAVNEMYILLGQSRRQNADGSPGELFVYQDQVCFYLPYAPYQPPDPIGTAGPCKAYRVSLQGGGGGGGGGGIPVLFAGDAGTVTVHGGIVDPLVLTPSSQTSGCYSSNVGYTVPQLFADGATLAISGSGGRDFPAFSMQVSGPPLIQVNTGSIQRGAPLLVSWTGSDPGGRMSIYVLTANADNSSVSYILCDVDDTNAYTIPASLTQQLEPSSGQGNFIRLDRDHMVHQEPASQSVVIQADIATTVTRIVSYTP